MKNIEQLLKRIPTIAETAFPYVARLALFVIFFVFGFLKIIDLSPATDLARDFTFYMGMGQYFETLFMGLAIVECVIGILFLIPRFTLAAVVLMFAHLAFVSAPIILFPSGTWTSLFVPNLEGQYIIKNLALIALGIGLLARTGSRTRKK